MRAKAPSTSLTLSRTDPLSATWPCRTKNSLEAINSNTPYKWSWASKASICRWRRTLILAHTLSGNRSKSRDIQLLQAKLRLKRLSQDSLAILKRKMLLCSVTCVWVVIIAAQKYKRKQRIRIWPKSSRMAPKSVHLGFGDHQPCFISRCRSPFSIQWTDQ